MKNSLNEEKIPLYSYSEILAKYNASLELRPTKSTLDLEVDTIKESSQNPLVEPHSSIFCDKSLPWIKMRL